MALVVGTRLGPYEIVGLRGKGGMGEVYRGRDTRLGRDVAVKVLPPELSADAGFRRRFEREAKAISQLQHPHVCTLYDVGAADGTDYLVMEYLEGETLEDRIARGPLPLEDLLRIGREIAAALDAAHRAGVVHRDLKPGNVMLTRSGAKVLDFGLAKSIDAKPLGADSDSPTATRALTAEGSIAGTLRYMAPEQIEGREVDARADLWALGVVLYEMATGARPFRGESQAGVIAAVLRAEPDAISSRRRASPARLDWVVARCLEKDPERRWQSARDVAIELEAVGAERPAEAPGPRRRVAGKGALAAAALGGAVLALAVIALLWPRRDPAAEVRGARGRRFSIVLPVEYPFDVPPINSPHRGVAISPDGEWLAYVASTGPGPSDRILVKRRLDGLHFEVMPGTEGVHTPVFSPNSRWIAYGSPLDNTIERVPIEGGTPVTVCQVSIDLGLGGMDWAEDGFLYFGLYSTEAPGVYRVPSQGGTPAMVSPADLEAGEQWRGFPELVDADHLLLTAGRGPEASALRIYALDLSSGASELLVEGGVSPLLLPTGHLVYKTLDALLAVPFDSGESRLRGGAVSVTPTGMSPLASLWSVSADGTLVYSTASIGFGEELAWLDRATGRVEPLGASVVHGNFAYLSWQGDRVAYPSLDERGDWNLWVYSAGTGRSSRLTSEPGPEFGALWHPNGREVIYSAQGEGVLNLRRRRVDNSEPPETLSGSRVGQYATSISEDGGTLIFSQRRDDTLYDVWAMDLADPHHPVRELLATEALELNGALSPDGGWLATSEGESFDRMAIVVRPYPALDAVHLVSEGLPAIGRSVWSRDGRELFFRTAAGVVAVSVGEGPTFSASSPRVIVPGEFRLDTFDTADGERFLISVPQQAEPVTELHVVTDWFDELERLAPIP